MENLKKETFEKSLKAATYMDGQMSNGGYYTSGLITLTNGEILPEIKSAINDDNVSLERFLKLLPKL